MTSGQPTPPAEIAVVIVNYGTPDLAIDAVESVLQRTHGGRSVEVHLLDNASPGDDAEAFERAATERNWQDRVRLYPEAENHGFGRGNNVMLRELAARKNPPDKVLFLNPDAEVHDTTIDTLAGVLDAQPEVAMVGCGISRPDSDDILVSAFRFPNPIGEFCVSAMLRPVSRLFSRWRMALPKDQPEGPVDWVSGAAMMARMEALQAADFFDPDFFLYYEEVEMMRRMTRAGWVIWYTPRTTVSHVSRAATRMHTKRSEERAPMPDYWYDSWRMYFLKQHGRLYLLLCATTRLSGWALNTLVRRLQRRRPDGALHFARDLLGKAVGPALSGGRDG